MKKQSVFFNYFCRNKKSFIIIIVMFFIGIGLGVFFVNHANFEQSQEIKEYVSKLISNIKNHENINKTTLLFQSIKQNVFTILLIWFLGCTIIGSIFIFIAIIYKGFSFGYTISSIIATLGIKKGVLFAVFSLFIQNVIFIPTLFLLAESGIRLYKVISKHGINIKEEVIRHSIIMLISIGLSIVSSFIEVYLSTNLVILCKNFF